MIYNFIVPGKQNKFNSNENVISFNNSVDQFHGIFFCTVLFWETLKLKTGL